jgi:hypothetical protein
MQVCVRVQQGGYVLSRLERSYKKQIVPGQIQPRACGRDHVIWLRLEALVHGEVDGGDFFRGHTK